MSKQSSYNQKEILEVLAKALFFSLAMNIAVIAMIGLVFILSFGFAEVEFVFLKDAIFGDIVEMVFMALVILFILLNYYMLARVNRVLRALA